MYCTYSGGMWHETQHVQNLGLQDNLLCPCKFYCAYQLPCQYIWQFHLMNGVITSHDCVIGSPARHMLEVMILKLGSLS